MKSQQPISESNNNYYVNVAFSLQSKKKLALLDFPSRLDSHLYAVLTRTAAILFVALLNGIPIRHQINA